MSINPYSLDIVTMMIMILLFIMLRGKQKANILMYKVYNWLVIVTFLAATFDLLYVEGMLGEDIYGNVTVIGVGVVYYTLLFLIMTLLTIYILCLAGINFSIDIGWKIATLLPFGIGAAGVIFSLIYGNLTGVNRAISIYMDDKKICLLAYSAYNIILWTIILLKYQKVMKSVGKTYILAFIMIHIVAGVIYIIMDFTGVYTFEMAMDLIVMIYAIQSPDDFFDKSDALLFKHFKDNIKFDITRDKAFSLIFVRLHDQDVIYDSFGENNTNKLLSKVVAFLNEIHKTALVYRVDKRTFAVKLTRLDEMSLHAIRTTILNRFKKEFKVGDLSAEFRVSIVAMNAPEDIKKEDSLDEMITLIRNVAIPIGEDISFSKLKENDKEAEIIEAVKKAVENNGFKVYYQPIYSTKKKKIVAAEALIRLFDDKLGFISPEVFIPLAEREGYILTIGEFVYTEVCRFYSENKLKEKGIDYIEVNLSAVQCMQYKLADEFVEIMHKYGLNSSQINFEITETSAMNKNSAVELNIHYFVDHGVDLSLDDYGTGYSNISYLYNLPFAFMKIDKSILWSSDKNDKANITLHNIFKMAKNLKMRTVVEGVETEEHIKKLLKLECDYFQGYYFSKPVAENDFMKYLEDFTVPEVCLA